MDYNEIYTKTVYAFEHNEVFELLTGQKGYAYQAPHYIATVPTCDEFVFREGIYPYYKSLSNEEQTVFLKALCAAFDKMISSNDSTLLWWALSMLQGQKDQESYFNRSPFKIADQYWNKLSLALSTCKGNLVKDCSYMGQGREHGLWDEVSRIARLLKNDYNINVL